VARTTSLRRQHDDLLKDMDAVAGLLKLASQPGTAARVLEQLATFSGKIKIHLAMEDNVLYPELLNASNTDTRATANSFKQEMGGIGQAFGAFRERWKTADDVEKNLAAFTREVRQFFELLKQRIQRENTQLYPLADAL
jgi:hemerythrin-like domain-containing protein